MSSLNDHSLMPSQCSYCGCWLEARPGPLNSISHGMCPSCFQKMAAPPVDDTADLTPPTDNRKNRQIVVLDDDPILSNLLVTALKRRGYSVLAFPHPKAYPVFSESACPCAFPDLCPDILFTDYSMPHVNGLDFLENLKTKQCRCRHFALMSGYAIPERDMKRIADSGVKFFIKPFTLDQIFTWLNEISPEA